MSFIDDINNLDPNNPGGWPVPVKLIVFAFVFVAIVAGGWYYDITKQQKELVELEKHEFEQIEKLERKQKKAANLKALRVQMKEMEQSFGDMLRQLPNKTEVAGLLIDISQTGLASGLEFKLFEPLKESPKEFYAELPIKLTVTGNYHQFGEFVSGVASLPRIVTTHDIAIKSVNKKELTGLLEMSAVAKTYRALEDEN